MQTISAEDIVRRIQTENPWWGPERAISPQFREMWPRPYLDLFLPVVKSRSVRRAVVLMGPRRVGKTVMIYQAIQAMLSERTPPSSICYFSVDHPLYNGLSLEQLLGHYSRASGVDYKSGKAYVFFDEIQYLRNWEVHLKSVVDAYPNLRCVASGSAAAALKLKGRESGAGRFTDFLLPPLTFYEYLRLLGKSNLVAEPPLPVGQAPSDPGLSHTSVRAPHKAAPAPDEAEVPAPPAPKTIEEPGEMYGGWFAATDIGELNDEFLSYLNFGGYPEAIFSPSVQADPARFIKSDIIDKVLLRDLPSLYGISDIQELNHLFTTLAFNTAGEVSLEELSQNSGVAKNTIKRYIEYLEAAFLIKVVYRVDRNAKRFRRANFFKVYLTNPSMRAALFSPLKAGDDEVARLAETAIFSQWFHSDEPIYYARWRDGEVDMVYLAADQKPGWAVEVKWSDRYCDNPAELKSLISFCHANGLGRPAVTSKTRTEVHEIEGVRLEFVPASVYCYTVGYNLIEGKKTRRLLGMQEVKILEQQLAPSSPPKGTPAAK